MVTYARLTRTQIVSPAIIQCDSRSSPSSAARRGNLVLYLIPLLQGTEVKIKFHSLSVDSIGSTNNVWDIYTSLQSSYQLALQACITHLNSSASLTQHRGQSEPPKGLSHPNNKTEQKCAVMTNWPLCRYQSYIPL